MQLRQKPNKIAGLPSNCPADRRQRSTTVSGNIDAIPDAIFRLMNEPSNYRGSNNKNYVRANDHNDRANNACGPLRLLQLLRQRLRLDGHLWRLRQLHRRRQFALPHPSAESP